MYDKNNYIYVWKKIIIYIIYLSNILEIVGKFQCCISAKISIFITIVLQLHYVIQKATIMQLKRKKLPRRSPIQVLTTLNVA